MNVGDFFVHEFNSIQGEDHEFNLTSDTILGA